MKFDISWAVFVNTTWALILLLFVGFNNKRAVDGVNRSRICNSCGLIKLEVFNHPGVFQQYCIV